MCREWHRSKGEQNTSDGRKSHSEESECMRRYLARLEVVAREVIEEQLVLMTPTFTTGVIPAYCDPGKRCCLEIFSRKCNSFWTEAETVSLIKPTTCSLDTLPINSSFNAISPGGRSVVERSSSSKKYDNWRFFFLRFFFPVLIFRSSFFPKSWINRVFTELLLPLNMSVWFWRPCSIEPDQPSWVMFAAWQLTHHVVTFLWFP